MMSGSRISGWLTVALSLAAVAVAVSQTVSLELKNGDRISGHLLGETNNTLILSNGWARELIIPLAEVTRRTTIIPPAEPAVAAAAMASTNAAAVAGATNLVVTTNAVALAKAVAATNTIFDRWWLKDVRGEIHAGVDLTFSERNRQVYNAKTKLAYAKDRTKNTLDADMTYGESETTERIIVRTPGGGTRTVEDTTKRRDANRLNVLMKNEYDFNRHWYGYHLGGAGYDEIRKIDLRYELGPGAGYRLIQWSNFFVNIEGGATYQREFRADDSDVSKFFGRVAENATWKITPRLSWDEKLEYMPSIDDPEHYRVRFETNLRYAMLQNVFFNLSLIDIYDSRPAGRVTRNDLQLRSSIGVKF